MFHKNARSCILALAVLLGYLNVFSAQQANSSPRPSRSAIEGQWFGAIQAAGTELRIEIFVHALADGSLKVAFASPDEGPGQIPGQARLEGTKFSFNIPAIGARYSGTLTADGRTINGQWTQSQPIPLNFTRQAPAKVVVAPPPSVVEKPVNFPTSEGLLVPGTLTVPAGRLGPMPVIVMVQGSGVQDRDATVGPNKLFRDLAWELAARNILTLRYDRRPMFAPSSWQAHPDLDHEITIDAMAALRYVAGLSAVDKRRIYLLGHSLGGTMAPYVAQARLSEQPGSVTGLILMAGAETTVDVSLIRQMHDLGVARGASPAQIAEVQSQWKAVFDEARDVKTPPEKLLGGKIPAGYWRDWMGRDPAAVLPKLPIPSLGLARNQGHKCY